MTTLCGGQFLVDGVVWARMIREEVNFNCHLVLFQEVTCTQVCWDIKWAYSFGRLFVYFSILLLHLEINFRLRWLKLVNFNNANTGITNFFNVSYVTSVRSFSNSRTYIIFSISCDFFFLEIYLGKRFFTRVTLVW